MNLETLKKIIFNAFKNAEYPGDKAIFPKEIEESLRKRNPPSDTYCAFMGARWEDVDITKMRNPHTTFLSVDAAIYFCPAILLSALHYGPIDSGSLHDFLCKFVYDNVSSPDQWEPDGWAEARAQFRARLNKGQVTAIIEFMRFVANPSDGRTADDDAQSSLAGSWSKMNETLTKQ